MNKNFKLMCSGVIFDFYQNEIEKNGKKQKFDLIKHNGAIAVLLKDGEELIFVKQFRYPVQDEVIEILAGKIEKNETDLKEVAKRECLEELGVEIKNLNYFDTIRPSGGVCTELITIFTADVLKYTDTTNFDEFESVQMVKMTKQEIIERIRTNKIVDGKTAYAVMRYYNEGN